MMPTTRLALSLLIALCACIGCGEAAEREARPATAETPAAAAADARDPAAPDRPPVVILVSIDTLRADHLGAYGYDRFTSPTLDLFALEGTLFEDASATAPWTLPSHASMLTGLFPMTHKVVTFSTSLPAETPTLASRMAGAGYRTAAAVSTSWLRREPYAITKDFDDYVYIETEASKREPNRWITDQALDWIDEAVGPKGQPLFLFLHYFDVHGDYVSEKSYEDLFVEPYEGIADGTSWQLLKSNFDPEYVEMCKREFDEKRCAFSTEDASKVIDANFEPVRFDEEDARHLADLYDAGIRQLDTELGRFFAALRQRDLLDQSLIVITSDHGEEFLEHGRVDHFLAPYQEVLRVPLIIRGPGIPAGRRVDAPVSLVDVVPTVLSLSGVPVPPDVEGLDLTPLLEGGDDAPYRQRHLYGEAPGGLTYEVIQPGMFPVIQSVRRDHWKLVYESKRDTYALYDLERDPQEKVDLAAEKPRIAAQLIDEMRGRYADFVPSELENSNVELSDEELEELRALGYVP